MKPYYDHMGVTIFHGDCREILPALVDVDMEVVITDPVWPNSLSSLAGADRPYELFKEAMNVLPPCITRIVVQLGSVRDPRVLAGMPLLYPVFRICGLPYAIPGH